MENSNTIRPRLIDGEPTCSGEECPALDLRQPDSLSFCRLMPNEPRNPQGRPCIPGLRRLLAEAREERDAARRELCRCKGLA